MNHAGSFVTQSVAIFHLLSTARAALETDREAAGACIRRALTLVRVRNEHRRRQERVVCDAPGALAPWQRRLIDAHLRTHLAEKVTAAELAQIAHLSASQLFRAFRESFGVPPMAYLARQRILWAQELMLTTNEPLSQIALACGLCDQAHFTRMFRRVAGTSPSRWRRGKRVQQSNGFIDSGAPSASLSSN